MKMFKDPVVEDARKRRRKIAKECDYDPEKMYKRFKEKEKTLKNPIVSEIVISHKKAS